MGLAGPIFAGRERWRAFRARNSPTVGSDGLPLPPPLLMVRVVGHTDTERFQNYGRVCAEAIREAVDSQGDEFARLESILDFGCGCGRVARHMRGLTDAKVSGCDLQPAAIEWCRGNLPFMDARVNRLAPPLPFGDRRFEMIYALSVFTHLSEPLQLDWMAEFGRVAAPGANLMFTVKGENHAERELDGQDLAAFRADHFVAKDLGSEGGNLCAAYSSLEWVAENLLTGFDLLDFSPGREEVMGGQATYLVRRR
jgi:SAM-dependent methyltransferase